MAIIGYARVSTKGQSLEVQLEQLKAAKCHKVFQEKVSGKEKANRPQLDALIDYVREEDVVVACKLDRIARSTFDLFKIVEAIQNKGAELKILNINFDTTTPTGKLMLTMLGAIATFERELMLERQADGIAKAKEAGKYNGRKPTAKAKAKEVMDLVAAGKKRTFIAKKLEIGIASVYRIIKENQKEISE